MHEYSQEQPTADFMLLGESCSVGISVEIHVQIKVMEWSYVMSPVLHVKHCYINNYISDSKMPNPTFRGVASLPLIFADIIIRIQHKSSRISPLIVFAA